jgi:hypothetical protein
VYASCIDGTTDVPPPFRLATAFTELALAI